MPASHFSPPNRPFSPEIARLVPIILYQATSSERRISYISNTTERLLGYEPGELIGTVLCEYMHEDDRRATMLDGMKREARQDFDMQYRIWRRNREGFLWVRDQGVAVSDGAEVSEIHGAIVDISQEKNLEKVLNDSMAFNKDLFNVNPVPMWVYDIDSLRFLSVNKAALLNYGYSEMEFKSMTLLDIRPAEDGEKLKIEVQKQPDGLYDAGTWRHKKKDGTVFPVNIASHKIVYDGRDAEIVVATDISQSVAATERAINVERELQSVYRLTVEALATATEYRDAYTAGHQRRVAKLSVAIARKIGLSVSEIIGIELGALIHDIGKLATPFEILAMPRRLTVAERALINEHPLAGQGMINELPFPWPISDIVRHHHERLDGSGYPDKLSGEQLSIGVRIVGVADVMEAITNHRPYRPGLGVEFGLNELRQGRATLYDPAVVDACITLFTDEGFRFD